MTPSLFIFATITPNKENYNQAYKAIQSILKPTRDEAGCLQFHLFKNSTDSEIYLFEEWTDELALEKHYNKDYTLAVMEKYDDWLARPLDVKKLFMS